jgi:uridine kinase
VTPERLAVLARVADALPDLDRPLLVAVDGGDGAGKTWFADDLAQHLEETGRLTVRATVDDFHHPRSFRPAGAAGAPYRSCWSPYDGHCTHGASLSFPRPTLGRLRGVPASRTGRCR